MTFELWMLLGATLLGLVHISVASFAFKMQVGNKYTVGARDEGLLPSGLAGRLNRAQANFMETYPYFAVCVIIVFITQSAGAMSHWGAALYVLGRIVYLPLYAAGLPWLRSFCWGFSSLGLVLVGIQVFF